MPVLEVIFQGVCVFFPKTGYTVVALVDDAKHTPVIAACAEYRVSGGVDLWEVLDHEEIRFLDDQGRPIAKASQILDFEGYPSFGALDGFPTAVKANVDTETGPVNPVCAARIALNGGSITTQNDADHVWKLAPVRGSGRDVPFDYVRAEVVYRAQLANDRMRIQLVKGGQPKPPFDLRAVHGKIRVWIANNDDPKIHSTKAAVTPRDFQLVYRLFEEPTNPSAPQYNFVHVRDRTRRREPPLYCIPKPPDRGKAQVFVTLPVPCVGGCTC